MTDPLPPVVAELLPVLAVGEAVAVFPAEDVVAAVPVPLVEALDSPAPVLELTAAVVACLARRTGLYPCL